MLVGAAKRRGHLSEVPRGSDPLLPLPPLLSRTCPSTASSQRWAPALTLSPLLSPPPRESKKMKKPRIKVSNLVFLCLASISSPRYLYTKSRPTWSRCSLPAAPAGLPHQRCNSPGRGNHPKWEHSCLIMSPFNVCPEALFGAGPAEGGNPGTCGRWGDC